MSRNPEPWLLSPDLQSIPDSGRIDARDPMVSCVGDVDCADLLIDAGEPERARELLLSVLRSAQSLADLRLQARAFASLSRADAMACRFRHAFDASSRAAHLFQRTGHVAAESQALAQHARAAGCLGRNEEAVEAALLSVRLADTLPACPQRAIANNDLGLAYAWSRGFERAETAFEAAARVAQECVPALSAFQPRVNHFWSEATRIFLDRYYGGRLANIQRLRALADACELVAIDGEPRCLEASARVETLSLWRLSRVLLFCWEGDAARASQEMEEFADFEKTHALPAWIHAMCAWTLAEMAQSRRDWAQALGHAQVMIDMAAQVEHEQIVRIGHLLASQIHEARGGRRESLQHLRQLRRREDRVLAESIDCRAQTVQWQVHSRAADQAPATESGDCVLDESDMEELSELPGVVQRQPFDGRAGAALEAGIRSRRVPCVIVVRVDAWEQIVAEHSPHAGQQVVRHLAHLITRHVRDVDLAARLANHEFAVLFERGDAGLDLRVSERIAASVARADWQSISDGLRVKILAGCAYAERGDSASTLLERARSAMRTGGVDAATGVLDLRTTKQCGHA